MASPAPGTPHTLQDFTDTFQVHCPRCGGCATVRESTESSPPRLTCTTCGLHQDWVAREKGLWFSGDVSSWKEGAYVLGGPADPYFHRPLWLQVPCCGQTLWAYNPRHLAFLRAYITATDRRRAVRAEDGPRNQLLESRLPRWMKAAKNREAVARGLTILEGKIP